MIEDKYLTERVDTLKKTQLKQLKMISYLENYKNAWEELKEDCLEAEKDNDYVLFGRLEQLENKHGIEVK